MPNLRGIVTRLSEHWLVRRVGLTPLAAAGSAVATLVACVPTCFGAAAATAGVTTLAVGIAQPWLLGVAIIFLGFGIVDVYRAKGSCTVQNRASVALLVVSAAIVTFMFVELLG